MSSGYYFIRRYAFYRCPNLTRVVIPSCIQSIETYAFNSCTALTEVVLKGESKIQAATFASNAALQNFYLPDVATIEQIPQLINVNAFTSTSCWFIVPNEASKIMYTTDSNWNTFANRFIVFNSISKKFYLPNLTEETANQILSIVNINTFLEMDCFFVVTNEESKNTYLSNSNWNALADKFIVEEATS